MEGAYALSYLIGGIMATRTKKENIAEEIIEEVTEVETQPTTKKTTTVKKVAEPEKKKRVFSDSDYILCRSVCSGGLNVTAPSGNCYEFKDYGSECEINYRDLISLIRKGSDHVFLPRFVILDEDLLDEFPTIRKAYASMYTKTDLLGILDLSISRMKAEIKKLPPASKSTLEKMVATEIANGHLDSISKVRALSEIFDSDFNLLSELFVR